MISPPRQMPEPAVFQADVPPGQSSANAGGKAGDAFSYHARRRKRALPRWRTAAAMRARGMTYADIGAQLGVSGPMAFRLCLKFQEHNTQ